MPKAAHSTAPRHPLGKLRLHKDFYSRHLEHRRNVVVWTPPGYAVDETARFPVMVLHDGQNLFDPKTSFIPGHVERPSYDCPDDPKRGDSSARSRRRLQHR
ncbi:MAG: hypothetical protein IPF82_17240 [Blastocatellia bacterium]|nr:hypothetical protein [Blastocatellia bacterium]